MKQKLFLILLLALSSLYAEAQIGEGCTIKFDYDAAGNRIKRYESCPNNQFREAHPDSLAALQAIAEEETKEDTNESILEKAVEAIDIAVLYPNPANSYCIVALNRAVENAAITLVDYQGKVVQYYASLSGKDIRLELSGVSTGTYKVVLHYEGKTVYKTVVKQ
jgi:hypothetical protein